MSARKKSRKSTKGAKALRAGSPPVGSIGQDAVERLVGQWVARPKLAADYARLSQTRLVAAAEALLERRGDLEAFVAARTPIKGSAFDYLAVLLRMVEEAPPLAELKEPARPPTGPKAKAALVTAMDSLGVVMARAEACGRPLRLFELSRAPWSMSGFVTQLLHVVQAGRRRAEKWDDPDYANTLFSTLERNALALERSWKLPPIGSPSSEVTLRSMALLRLLWDAVTYLAAYGRAVFPPHDKRHAYYRLTQMFPARPKPGLPSPLTLLRE